MARPKYSFLAGVGIPPGDEANEAAVPGAAARWGWVLPIIVGSVSTATRHIITPTEPPH